VRKILVICMVLISGTYAIAKVQSLDSERERQARRGGHIGLDAAVVCVAKNLRGFRFFADAPTKAIAIEKAMASCRNFPSKECSLSICFR